MENQWPCPCDNQDSGCSKVFDLERGRREGGEREEKGRRDGGERTGVSGCGLVSGFSVREEDR